MPYPWELHRATTSVEMFKTQPMTYLYTLAFSWTTCWSIWLLLLLCLLNPPLPGLERGQDDDRIACRCTDSASTDRDNIRVGPPSRRCCWPTGGLTSPKLSFCSALSDWMVIHTICCIASHSVECCPLSIRCSLVILKGGCHLRHPPKVSYFSPRRFFVTL